MLEIAGVDPVGFDIQELFEMVHEEFTAEISPNKVTLILWRFLMLERIGPKGWVRNNIARKK